MGMFYLPLQKLTTRTTIKQTKSEAYTKRHFLISNVKRRLVVLVIMLIPFDEQLQE